MECGDSDKAGDAPALSLLFKKSCFFQLAHLHISTFAHYLRQFLQLLYHGFAIHFVAQLARFVGIYQYW
jgi:hypothetical protein